MATTNSLHHHHHSSSYTHHRHNLHCQSHFGPTSLFLKQSTSAATFSLICSASSSSSAVSAVSTKNASATTAETATKFDVLENHLVNQNFRQAYEETRRLLIQIAGEAAVTRGYVFFFEVNENQFQQIQCCESAKEAWDKLRRTYEGTSKVKTSKLDMLASRFETLRMEDNETIRRVQQQTK